MEILSTFRDFEDETAVLQWFALRVKSGRERAIAASARSKGFEEFLPVYKHRRQWSDRLRVVEAPLFPGYVFCRINLERRLPLLTIPGVLHFVSVGKTPVAIDDLEMATIQNAIRFELSPEPASFTEAGERVRVVTGPLAGAEGFLVETPTRKRLAVSLSVLRRAVTVQVEPDWVGLSG